MRLGALTSPKLVPPGAGYVLSRPGPLVNTTRSRFGVSDDDEGYSYRAWRQDWIQAGMPWRGAGDEPPTDWNPVQQLAGLPKDEPI